MKRRHVAIIVSAVLLYLVGSLLSPPDMSTSYSAKPKGNKAFFMLLEQQGLKLERWLYPFSELKSETGSTLFLVNPASLAQEDELIAWVKTGNTLVLFDGTRSPTETLLRALHFWKPLKENLAKEMLTAKLGAKTYEWSAVSCPNKFGEACRAVNKVSRLTPALRVSAECDGVVAGRCDDSQIFRRAIGAGVVWVFANADIISNEYIDKFDNLRFIYQIAASGKKIYVDEFHHGYSAPVPAERSQNMAAIKGLIGYLALILIIGALSRSVRFGPPIKVANQDISSLSDFVAVLGILYKESDSTDILRYYLRSWKDRIAKRYGFSAGNNDDTFIYELTNRAALNGEQQEVIKGALIKQTVNPHTISQLESFL